MGCSYSVNSKQNLRFNGSVEIYLFFTSEYKSELHDKIVVVCKEISNYNTKKLFIANSINTKSDKFNKQINHDIIRNLSLDDRRYFNFLIGV